MPSSLLPAPPSAAPGGSFRLFRLNGPPSDLAALGAVHEACRTRDALDPYSVCYRLPFVSARDYEKDVAQSFADNQTENVLMAESNGRVIAHSRLEWWDEWDDATMPPISRRVYLVRGWVVPEWRGKGIGRTLLGWAENRARMMDEGQAHQGELAANAADNEQDTIALLEKAGYAVRFLSPELGFDDWNGLPPPFVPPGFVFRPLSPVDFVPVAHVLVEANCPANWTPDQIAFRAKAEQTQWTEFLAGCDPALSRIAWVENNNSKRVAGLVVCRRKDDCGDVANVAVLPAYRGRGVARALVFDCLRAMRDAQLKTVRVYTGIGAERDAPPSGPFLMYQKFGFRTLAFHRRYRKPMQTNQTPRA